VFPSVRVFGDRFGESVPLRLDPPMVADLAMRAAPGVDDGPGAAAEARSKRLRVLVAAYQDFVWRSLRRLGVPAAQVDDARQEVFCVAMRRLEHIEPGSERSFLFSVTMRVASDARRACARSRERTDQEAVDVAAATSPTPEGLLGKQEALALLDEALDALDDDVRAVFVLSEIEGFTSPEIASLLAVPLGTVASRLRRGREQFHAAATRLRARMNHGGRR
jgi:RNA polymerase sigma-70 factor (ECF subfamily)